MIEFCNNTENKIEGIVMAWIAVDFDGEEHIYASEPERSEECRCWQVDS